MNRIPVDLDYASVGYLWSPDRKRLRYLSGLAEIASDAQRLGVRVYWARCPGDHAGYCYCDAGVILLAPWLWWAHRWCLLAVIAHELGHVVNGPSDARAEAWMMRLYRSLVEPAVWV